MGPLSLGKVGVKVIDPLLPALIDRMEIARYRSEIKLVSYVSPLQILLTKVLLVGNRDRFHDFHQELGVLFSPFFFQTARST